MMNVFQIFIDFATYLGTGKAALMVVAYFLGDALIKKLPAALEQAAENGNKLANFLLYDFALKRCPVVYDLY